MSNGFVLDRNALSQVFQDPRTLIAIENLMQQALDVTPASLQAIEAILNAAKFVTGAADADLPASRVLTGSTGVTIDQATAGLIRVLVDVAVALGYTPANQTDVAAIEAAPVITSTATGAFSGERVLTGSTGITIDLSTAGLAAILVSVVTALGYTPADRAGDTFTGTVIAPLLHSTGSVNADGGFVTGQTPAASTTASDGSIPINCNGVIWYLRLSSTP